MEDKSDCKELAIVLYMECAAPLDEVNEALRCVSIVRDRGFCGGRA